MGLFDKEQIEYLKSNTMPIALLAVSFMYIKGQSDYANLLNKYTAVYEQRVQEQKEAAERDREDKKFAIDSFIELARVRDSKRHALRQNGPGGSNEGD